ncbi:hypothetical protein CfE428DRAFT_4986 [Chthoniobacter flavus Ellin428]|uniref:Uncharacterized protein n=2 Tax=Chthoniobacter flavus TaxID=191863 RepID=B4D7U6_9BACT|nr:hypothetical protein CfE428DRAFT_4986 [Chthoniobacter flavus Ellin428]
MVSMSVVGVVGLVMFSVMISTMRLSTVNTATNLSNYRTRQALDRLADTVHYDSVDMPAQINSDGTTASGGTSDGILIKHLVPGMYVFLNSDGTTADIASTASAFTLQYATSAWGTLPQPYDYFLLASSTAPELEIPKTGGVGTPTTSNGVTSVAIKTTAAVGEKLTPSYYTVTAVRYRKEAYIFVQNGTSAYWTLRFYPTVYPGMDYTNAQNYYTLGTGFEKQGTQGWFTASTDSANNNTQAIWLQALVRSSGHGEYSEDIDKRNTATTMPLQIKLWNYTTPSTTAPSS